MTRVFEQSVIIARPRREVWALFEDLRTMPRWVPGLRSARLEGPGPLQAGSRLVETREVRGKLRDIPVEVLAFEPGQRLVRAASTPAGRYTYSYTFADAPGGTRVTLRAEAEPERLAQRLVFGIGLRMVREQDGTLMQRAKEILEGPGLRAIPPREGS